MAQYTVHNVLKADTQYKHVFVLLNINVLCLFLVSLYVNKCKTNMSVQKVRQKNLKLLKKTTLTLLWNWKIEHHVRADSYRKTKEGRKHKKESCSKLQDLLHNTDNTFDAWKGLNTKYVCDWEPAFFFFFKSSLFLMIVNHKQRDDFLSVLLLNDHGLKASYKPNGLKECDHCNKKYKGVHP